MHTRIICLLKKKKIQIAVLQLIRFLPFIILQPLQQVFQFPPPMRRKPRRLWVTRSVSPAKFVSLLVPCSGRLPSDSAKSVTQKHNVLNTVLKTGTQRIILLNKTRPLGAPKDACIQISSQLCQTLPSYSALHYKWNTKERWHRWPSECRIILVPV